MYETLDSEADVMHDGYNSTYNTTHLIYKFPTQSFLFLPSYPIHHRLLVPAPPPLTKINKSQKRERERERERERAETDNEK